MFCNRLNFETEPKSNSKTAHLLFIFDCISISYLFYPVSDQHLRAVFMNNLDISRRLHPGFPVHLNGNGFTKYRNFDRPTLKIDQAITC